MEAFADEIASLRAAREAEYEKIRSGLSKEKYEGKISVYKINSSIKYEAHVRSEKHAELQTQLSTLHAVPVSSTVSEK